MKSQIYSSVTITSLKHERNGLRHHFHLSDLFSFYFYILFLNIRLKTITLQANNQAFLTTIKMPFSIKEDFRILKIFGLGRNFALSLRINSDQTNGLEFCEKRILAILREAEGLLIISLINEASFVVNSLDILF